MPSFNFVANFRLSWDQWGLGIVALVGFGDPGEREWSLNLRLGPCWLGVGIEEES